MTTSEAVSSFRVPIFSSCSKLQKLAESENKILTSLGIKYLSRLIKIPFQNSEINTITVECEQSRPKVAYPIVLIHGFGAGSALWGSAIKRFAQIQTVFAMDLLGFARSSRPKFSENHEEAESEIVESIEMWRNEMRLEKMNIVAHSFGGYLATSYAIKYPSRVHNLILADPWGFTDKDPNRFPQTKTIRFIRWFVETYNPLTIMRMFGSFGPNLMRRTRPDLKDKYSENVYDYIYLCNSQRPSGEKAFKNIATDLAWAKRPMAQRFHELDTKVPVTFIHGVRSWIDYESVSHLYDLEHVNQYVVEGAGHHVYADNSDRFNDIVVNTLENSK
ncbi:unnamed protein product [Caenorhabditis angaria]|uniref:AB hydrolase-1 domain-containing protein n=1 Tax=Caenorhabditis angaria TaxID=860376 RepID=A0A9P1IXQ8_9PELO|nr:unnamed protein product [Caenorhabditis angaria]